MLDIRNNNPFKQYSYDSQPGAQTPPLLAYFSGPYDEGLYFYNAPFHAALYLTNPYNNDMSLESPVLGGNFSGQIGYKWSTGNWQVDNTNLYMNNGSYLGASNTNVGSSANPLQNGYFGVLYANGFAPPSGYAYAQLGNSSNPFYWLYTQSIYDTGLTAGDCVQATTGGQLVSAAAACGGGISNPITSATAASGITSATCITASCTNLRGSYTIVGGTFTGGTFLTLVWPTTTTAYVCTVTQNNTTGETTSFLSIGHSVATATGMTISSGITLASQTFTVDYHCLP